MSGAVLVVDDHPAALAGLAYALRDRWEVIVAATVAEALAVLEHLTPAAVVLDLLLDADAAPLHRELVLRAVPVVAVSGIEASAAAAIARVWGWRYVAKPPGDDTLTAAVTAALETSPMTEATHTPTMAPPPPDAPLPAPPHTPDADSVSPLAATNERVTIEDMRTRRGLRLVMGLCVTGLTVFFELRGHAVPGWAVGVLTVLAVGLSGGIEAIRKRPALTGGGAAALVALAVGGGIVGSHEAEVLAVLGAGAIPFVDEAVKLVGRSA